MFRRIAVAFILMLMGAVAWTYDPLTDEEIESWWGGLPKETRLEELRTWDLVEHSAPVLDAPRLVVVVTEGEAAAYWVRDLEEDPRLIITVADTLRYEITLPTTSAEIAPPELKVPFVEKLKYAGIGGAVILPIAVIVTMKIFVSLK